MAASEATVVRHISHDEAQPPFFVGVDLGGTNTKIGVVDDLGRPLGSLSIPTEPEKGPEDAVRRMAEAIRRIVEQSGLSMADVARIGLGSPGTMDIPKGMLLKPVNLVGWDNFPIRDRLRHHCGGISVAFINDAAAAAYGEYWVGSGREFHSLVLLTLGTGIGCGIIIGDLSIDGENSHGAECGHIIIDPADDARWCNCGQRGHLEAYASATAVIRRTRDALEANIPSSLHARLRAGETLTPKLVAEEAEKGDPLSRQIVFETAHYLAIGIATLIHTIDPNGVLLGGAMTFGGHGSPLGREFLERIRQETRRRIFPTLAERTIIDFAALGPEAGYIGAAGVARVEYRRELGLK
jgi:glucokinase